MIYESYYIKAQASGGGGSTPVGATLMKTGQTTSYRTGDDGDLEAGRATDFFTLSTNNPFGNTNRFTDELGGSTYTNNIVIDWSTYDNIGGTVLGYYTGDSNTARTWNNAIDWGVALSVGTFTTGWRLTNLNELCNILNANTSSLLNYAPFSHTTALWSSTGFSTNAMVLIPQISQINQLSKSSSYRTYACRTFSVSGTTLT